MTHEYVIAINGHIEPDPAGDSEETALAWAAKRGPGGRPGRRRAGHLARRLHTSSTFVAAS